MLIRALLSFPHTILGTATEIVIDDRKKQTAVLMNSKFVARLVFKLLLKRIKREARKAMRSGAG
jgi:hypothetical protein